MTNDYLELSQLPASKIWHTLQAGRLPATFSLELTARCNMNCRHCYLNLPANDGEARAREMTLAEIDDFAGQAVELGALWCLLTGGDPLLRADFLDIYLLLKRKGLLVSVYTNATLITEEHVRLWREYPPRDLEVTVYGAAPDTYERITQRPGSHAAFKRGLQRLRDAGIPVRLKAMVMRSNIHEFPAIAEFCRDHTKDYSHFDPILHLRSDGDPERNAMIAAERLSPDEIIEFEQALPDRMNAWQQKCMAALNSSHEIDTGALFRCGAGRGVFNISYDGRFRLCISLDAPGTTYDLRQGSLRDAWERFTPVVRALRASSPDTSCGSCKVHALCNWCPALAYLETGSLEAAPPYFCALAHARERALQPAGDSA
jgi:radical SAM protein with 4Fe4S-binding SPASM domain